MQPTIIHPSIILARRMLTFATVAGLIDQLDNRTALELFAHAILLSNRHCTACKTLPIRNQLTCEKK